MNEQAAAEVRGPAIGLIVTSAVGVVSHVANLLIRVLGLSFAVLGDNRMGMFSGARGVIMSVIAISTAGLVVFAATQMMKLSKYNLCLAGTVIAMVPCTSPCCCLGLPIGIWALVVLLKPEVKQAFID